LALLPDTDRKRLGAVGLAHLLPAPQPEASQVPSGPTSPATDPATVQGHVQVPQHADSTKPLEGLREQAIKCLKGSRDAVEALAAQLWGDWSVFEAPTLAEKVVSKLIMIGADRAVQAILAGYQVLAPQKKSGQQKAACKIIVQFCELLIPIIYRKEDIYYVIKNISYGNLMITLPVYYATTIEIILAGAHGQKLRLKPVSSPKDYPEGDHFYLHTPPESGMDDNGNQFINDFIKFLRDKFATRISLDHPILDEIILGKINNDLINIKR
jgi:hypothetical protein